MNKFEFDWDNRTGDFSRRDDSGAQRKRSFIAAPRESFLLPVLPNSIKPIFQRETIVLRVSKEAHYVLGFWEGQPHFKTYG